jgi:hypothetical protein
MQSLVKQFKTFSIKLSAEYTESDFVKFEMLLRLCERLHSTSNPDSFYLLLSRKDLFYDKEISQENYLIFHARKLLHPLNASKYYRDVKNIYKASANRPYCFYTLEDTQLKRNLDFNQYCPDRIAQYDSILDAMDEGSKKKPVQSKTGKYSINFPMEDKRITVALPKLRLPALKVSSCMKKGDSQICVPIADLMKTAQDLDRRTGQSYRYNVLYENLYVPKQTKKVPVTEILIDGKTNLLGQVASGKSTLAECLTVNLIERGYRVLLIQPTVELVLKQGEFFHNLKYPVGTLIGNSNLIKHIANQMYHRTFLNEYQSYALQQPCLLNALLLNLNCQETIPYGKEPCFNLRSEEQKKSTTCPYLDVCPARQRDRDVISSNVVITTLAGLCFTKLGQTLFLDYALNNFDLFIFDEADSTAVQLDNLFAPSIDLKDLVKKVESCRSNYISSDYLHHGKDQNIKSTFYLTQFPQIESAIANIASAIENAHTGWPNYILKSFSGFNMLDAINPNNKLAKKNDTECIPSRMWNILNSSFWGYNNIADIFVLFYNAGVFFDWETLEDKLKYLYGDREVDWAACREDSSQLSSKMKKKLIFLLRVLAFEYIYNTTSNSISTWEEIPPALYGMLTFTLRQQQIFLPSSPTGNILSLEWKDNSLWLKKQFVLGRALELCLRKLIINTNGKPCGPHALLMSGTGFIPGSSKFHLGNQVNYIIEATAKKREFISRTQIINMHSTVRVSGASLDTKNECIKALINESAPTIIKRIQQNDNILIIANSYNQCKVGYSELSRILRKERISFPRYYLKEIKERFNQVSYDDSDSITRRDITHFEKGILFAPACVIDRGYNIIDPLGNARFDTVMFMVRPVPHRGYQETTTYVNGSVIQEYYASTYEDRIELEKAMREFSFFKRHAFENASDTLRYLSPELKREAITDIFITIEQVFGRLCRLGSTIKEKTPTIYWMDGAFNPISATPDKTNFDTVGEISAYLRDIMQDSCSPIVAKTLYKPLYIALQRSN